MSPIYWVLAALFGVFVFMTVMFCYSMYTVRTVFYYNSSEFSLLEWLW